MERAQEEELSAEAIQSPALPLEGIDHVHGSDSLPLGMFSVGNRIPDHILKEHLQNTPGLLRDELHSTSPGQSPNSRLSDALDVIPEHLPVPLGTSLAQTFASLSATSHVASETVGK